MQRSVALALGVSSLLVAGLALGPGDVRAGEKGSDEKKVVKQVQVVRVGGGAFLGVGLDDVEGDGRGAKVRSVESDSPAAKAGLKEGDVIVRFDGESVRSATQLARLVRETPAGRVVAVEVNRGGATQKLTATLAARGGRHVRISGEDIEIPDIDVEVPEPPTPPHVPMPPQPLLAPHAPMPHAFSWNDEGGRHFDFRLFPGGPRKLGIEYQEIEGQLAVYFKLAEKTGVLVTSVDADGPAGKAGMKAGDLILKLDGKAIKSGADLREVVGEAEGGKEVTVTVQRDGKPVDLKVTLAKPEAPRHRTSGVSL